MSLYLAFASGSIAFHCKSCGRCCKNEGLVTAAAQHPMLHQIGAFRVPNDHGAFASFYNFADGCRFLAEDNGCDIHTHHGRNAKPNLCRLFPFSRLVRWDGLLTLLPQGSCPWVASALAPAEVSRHTTILADLEGLPLELLSPAELSPITSMPPNKRLALELRLRDALTLDLTLDDALAEMAVIQSEMAGPALDFAPLDLLLDLLRCAGEPPPLSDHNRRLFLAALPALRVELSLHLPLFALPAALRAFALWLAATSELSRRDFTGEDLLHFVRTSLPLVKVLACAACPIPTLGDVPEAWEPLRLHQGQPLGEAIAFVLRFMQDGAVTRLTTLGATLPLEAFVMLQSSANNNDSMLAQ